MPSNASPSQRRRGQFSKPLQKKSGRPCFWSWRGRAVKAQDVGEELNVRYIVEGSVRKAGDRVRISAQLIKAATGHQLWAERFDRKLEDVFEVQDEVSRKIVATLIGRLNDSVRGTIVATKCRRPTIWCYVGASIF